MNANGNDDRADGPAAGDDGDDDLPERVERAFASHGSFAPADGGGWTATTTPFEARATATTGTDGRVDYRVVVRVPALPAVVDGDVAPVVADGWADTFERRVADVVGVVRGDDASTTVERDDDPDGPSVVVAVAFSDLDPRRAVDDAGSVVDFVEGTYVQGVIPGYDYTEPVTSLLGRARATGGSGSGSEGEGGDGNGRDPEPR